MKTKRWGTAGTGLLAGFVLWTVLIQRIDVRQEGPLGTWIGFATLNVWFHSLTGVHMTLYTVTDWLGLVPILICCCFGTVGLLQWIRRKKLLQVDRDILYLGVYYLLVIFGYLFFEMVPINYRPVLIDGCLEASYPSSTTLLVLSVLPTLKFQTDRRLKNAWVKHFFTAFTVLFSAFMVAGRLIAGVHWFTDIIGSVLLSAGLFLIYLSAVNSADQRNAELDQEG